MDFKTLQLYLRTSSFRTKKLINPSMEAVMAILDELGDFALMEGEDWDAEIEIDYFSDEVTHLLNMMFMLSHEYDIDYEGIYAQKIH
jgi:hypothetical protein